uniref:Putative secreted peptide n=1 Tax=Anopheles braziliensis TaxID=58242 RepID=A0A2M3ZX22_9DIPT
MLRAQVPRSNHTRIVLVLVGRLCLIFHVFSTNPVKIRLDANEPKALTGPFPAPPSRGPSGISCCAALGVLS